MTDEQGPRGGLYRDVHNSRVARFPGQFKTGSTITATNLSPLAGTASGLLMNVDHRVDIEMAGLVDQTWTGARRVPPPDRPALDPPDRLVSSRQSGPRPEHRYRRVRRRSTIPQLRPWIISVSPRTKSSQNPGHTNTKSVKRRSSPPRPLPLPQEQRDMRRVRHYLVDRLRRTCQADSQTT